LASFESCNSVIGVLFYSLSGLDYAPGDPFYYHRKMRNESESVIEVAGGFNDRYPSQCRTLSPSQCRTLSGLGWQELGRTWCEADPNRNPAPLRHTLESPFHDHRSRGGDVQDWQTSHLLNQIRTALAH